MILHTVADYEFYWQRADSKKVSDKLIRELIGESIPPAGLEKIFYHLAKILQGVVSTEPRLEQQKLAFV